MLFLDDDARFDFYGADIVLNQNIKAKPEMYGRREPGTQLLLEQTMFCCAPSS